MRYGILFAFVFVLMSIGGCQRYSQQPYAQPNYNGPVYVQQQRQQQPPSMADMGPPPGFAEGCVLKVQNGLRGIVARNLRLVGGESTGGEAVSGEELSLDLGMLTNGKYTVKVDMFDETTGECVGVASKDVSVRREVNCYTGTAYYVPVRYWLLDDYTPLRDKSKERYYYGSRAPERKLRIDPDYNKSPVVSPRRAP